MFWGLWGVRNLTIVSVCSGFPKTRCPHCWSAVGRVAVCRREAPLGRPRQSELGMAFKLELLISQVSRP
eukprot:6151184-Amphidinium_carterae.1